MDIFYYWKNFESDLANGRVGWLISKRKKLGELNDRHPGCIWTFRTPMGRKGELQVLAKLEWMSDRPSGVAVPKAQSAIFYDVSSPNTVRFCGSDTDDAISAITSILKRRPRFHTAFMANFQGDNGVQTLENDVVQELERAVRGLSIAPLV